MKRRRTETPAAGLATLCLCLGLWLGLGGIPTALAGGDDCGPDSLEPSGDGKNCCEGTSLTLPAFPAIDLVEARYFTWLDCSIARDRRLCVSVEAPKPQVADCGLYIIPFSLVTCGDRRLELFSGDLNAVYARTFIEEDLGSKGERQVQVWRFLVNGDLEASPLLIERFGDNPNVPQSYRDFGNLVHWTGYIDYRVGCGKGGGTWEIEWVLSHECDEFTHGPESARPGTYYPGRSFGMASGNFRPVEDFIGDVLFDFLPTSEMRELDFGGKGSCPRPAQSIGAIEFLDGFCACVEGKGGPALYSRMAIGGDSACGAELSLAGKDLMTAKFLGFFVLPPEGKGGEEIPYRFAISIMGDSEWRAACEKSIEADPYQGWFVASDPGRFTFEDPFAGRKPESIGSIQLDLANTIDPSGMPVVGAPHLSDRMLNANLGD